VQKKIPIIFLCVPAVVPAMYLFFVTFVSGYVEQGDDHWSKALGILKILVLFSYLTTVMIVAPVFAVLMRKRQKVALLPALCIPAALGFCGILAIIWPSKIGEGTIMFAIVMTGINSIFISIALGFHRARRKEVVAD